MALSKRLLAAWTGCALIFLAATAGAQTTTKSTEYRNFEVISVDGNKVVYKSEKGIREVTLPDDFKLTMDGKTIGVHDLKPGMKGTAAITTTTTTQPVTVTEVRNAKVLATAGNAIIVRGQNGVRKFTIDDVADKNITIIREGERVDLQSLRVGDMLTATIITRHPPTVMTEQQASANVHSAPAPAAAPAAAPAPAPAAAAAPASEPAPAHASKKLPKTASDWPLVGLAGALLLASGLFLNLRRRLQRSQ